MHNTLLTWSADSAGKARGKKVAKVSLQEWVTQTAYCAALAYF